ncbi:hypothetical protein ACLK19_01365 [Escherichia coli]
MADAMPLNADKNAARDVLGIPGDLSTAWRCYREAVGAEVEMRGPDFLKTACFAPDICDLEIVVCRWLMQTPRAA